MLLLFAIKLSTRKVELLGIGPQPDGRWMARIARNLSNGEGLLAGHRFLIRDRDPLLTEMKPGSSSGWEGLAWARVSSCTVQEINDNGSQCE